VKSGDGGFWDRSRAYPAETHPSPIRSNLSKDAARVANGLAVRILGTRLDELSGSARHLLELLEAMVGERARRAAKADDDGAPDPAKVTFTRQQVSEYAGWGRTRLHVHLHELLETEYVIPLTGARSGPQYYRLLYAGEGRDGSRFLPGLKDVATLCREINNAPKK